MNFHCHSGADSTGIGTVLLAALAVAVFGEARPTAARPVRDGRQTIVPAGASRSLVRYHFDEPVELQLDPDRIAVWAPDGVGSVLPGEIVPGSVEPLAVPGWHLLRLKASTDAEEVPTLLDDLAPALGCEFVSPVFFDDFGGPLVPTRELLVQFAPEVEPDRAESVLAASGAGEILDREWAGLPRAYRLRSAATSGLAVLACANALAQRPDVRFAEPDFMFTGRAEQAGPDDPSFARSWGLESPAFVDYCLDLDWDMSALDAWKITPGDPSVRVLIIDTGVDSLHPDLNLDPGEDFTGQGGGGDPVNACDNHGTKVAGCVSMIAGNGLGSVGIAPGCKVVSARCFISNTSTCNGSWTSNASWTVNALYWAENNGIKITNNSNGYGFTSSAIETAYLATRNGGAVHFASAGNAGTNQIAYPARVPGVNAVGNYTYWGYVNSSSCYGPELEFVAPGTNIFTTDRTGTAGSSSGDYVWGSGTSFASPYTAGIAALLRSQDPTMSPGEIERRLRDSAFDLEEPGWDDHSGWGLVQAARALTMQYPTPVLPVLFGAEPPPDPRGTCERPSFSDDGRYAAFRSFSSKLVPGDANDVPDVFVRDLQTQAIDRMSVDSAGTEANQQSGWPSISADGRYVAFESRATNLVAGDTNGVWDVFVHDRQTGVTTRVSEGTGGIQGNAGSRAPDISVDGRYVAFQSWATNFDTAANGYGLVYVHDRLTQTTTLVTKTAGGQGADKSCHLPTISADGMRVAFFSSASNLIAGVGGITQAYVADVGSSTFILASVEAGGLPASSSCYRATISGDGNRVSFWTLSALDPADTNGKYDVYVRDILGGTTLGASTDASGTFGARDAYGLRLSGDGRYVVVLSTAPLVPGDGNNLLDAFRKDLQTGAVVRVSLRPGGQEAMGGCTQPWISSDGGMVGFVCSDDELTPGDELDGFSDVYLHTIATGLTVLVTGGS